MGLHALQLLPLAGWAISHRGPITPSRQVAAMLTVGVLYAATAAWLFTRALAGRPLLGL